MEVGRVERRVGVEKGETSESWGLRGVADVKEEIRGRDMGGGVDGTRWTRGID